MNFSTLRYWHSFNRNTSMKYLVRSLFFLVSISISADTFQNINGFFGERAAGMGGAYSAISDDVSGTYYNPGGTAFAQNSYYSINASSYNQIKVNHKNLFGPGQNYRRNSRNYLPNFIGFIKKDGKWTYGFSVLNPINQSFDQSDRITLLSTAETYLNWILAIRRKTFVCWQDLVSRICSLINLELD
ncbi:MAG: hypothetical protein IPQ05_10590 [Leptospiraceae bacterium]|nr:hypothetical protein [Leptospiraceae bacterium]